jgi:hypothetical protein
MRICLLYSGDHHAFFDNLFNVCDVCDYCTHCRPLSLNFTHNIYGIFQIPGDLPTFVEDPYVYMPPLPECDLVIALEIHPDILLELPEYASKSQVKALIVPADAPHWVRPGLRNQMQDILENISMEYAFPKPYCSLDYDEHHPLINEFISQYRIGRPLIDIEVRKNIVHRATCVRSAPCGSTWYICERLKNVHLDCVVETVSAAHHAYPCNASMVQDPEIKDTILHEAGYTVREAVLQALEKEGISLDEVVGNESKLP